MRRTKMAQAEVICFLDYGICPLEAAVKKPTFRMMGNTSLNRRLMNDMILDKICIRACIMIGNSSLLEQTNRNELSVLKCYFL